MNFFVPQASPRKYEETYNSIKDSIKDQLRWQITDKRILSFKQVDGKKKYTFKVGELEPQNGKYQILTIMESNTYLVYTRAINGDAGTTILVNKEQVNDVTEFDKGLVDRIRK